MAGLDPAIHAVPPEHLWKQSLGGGNRGCPDQVRPWRPS